MRSNFGYFILKDRQLLIRVADFFTFFFNTGAQAEIEEEEEAPKQKNYRHNLNGPKGRFVKKPRDKSNSNLNYALINISLF